MSSAWAQSSRPAFGGALGMATHYLGYRFAALPRNKVDVHKISRYHITHAHDGSAIPTLAEAEAQAPDKLKKRLKDIAKLPWDIGMSYEQAAKALGSFVGIHALTPGTVLNLDKDQLYALLHRTTNQGDQQLNKALFAYADSVTDHFFKQEIYYRGIVEFSNICISDCHYCGIRKHQPGVKRYTIPLDEVLEVARWAFTNRMGTLMLQSGELPTPQRMEYLDKLVKGVREATVAQDIEERGLDLKAVSAEAARHMGLCVAMSVGELSREQYQQLYDAGARRYLLRIETSNPELFSMLHPPAQTWENRVNCMKRLKDVGFQLGTGIMVGLPGQTLQDLAEDLVFFKQMEADMIGMGPYITEPDTPAAAMWESVFGHKHKKAHMRGMLELTTRMNSLARITLGNVNIAATTALQAIDPMGREIALRRGCNILMPILTPTKYREHYQLYEGKPCITDTADECRKCLNARVGMIGKKIKSGVWGDPPSFLSRQSGVQVPVQSDMARGMCTCSNSLHRSFHTTTGMHTLTCSFHHGLHTSPSWSTAACAAPAVACKNSPHHPDFSRALGHELPYAPSTLKGSDVPRVNIGVFGIMNAGKSTLMNRITRQETSIVDGTPGTTADVKTTLMELHEIGPVKLFDTAGIDEEGELGEKKRRKTYSALKESDVAVLVLDMPHLASCRGLSQALHWEMDVLAQARRHELVPLLLFNFKGMEQGSEGQALLKRVQGVLDPAGECVGLPLDLNDPNVDVPSVVANFLQDGVSRSRKRPTVRALPEWALAEDSLVFLNIPMDAETPSLRLLRPQALVQEEAIRFWATTVGYRMDLARARSGQPKLVEAERSRFMRALDPALKHTGPKLLVTDSQAMDIVHPWTLDAQTGEELLPITTFSIAMIHRQSGGKLPQFVEGMRVFKNVKPGDKVLIAEACNHNRITEICKDIGMCQIPQQIDAKCGKGVQLEHAFGYEYPDLDDGLLAKFKLAIHCGGCMIDQQKMRARITDMEEAGVPVTNYGLFLSYVHNPAGLKRVLAPWGVNADDL